MRSKTHVPDKGQDQKTTSSRSKKKDKAEIARNEAPPSCRGKENTCSPPGQNGKTRAQKTLICLRNGWCNMSYSSGGKHYIFDLFVRNCTTNLSTSVERYVRPTLGTSRDIKGEYWYIPLPFLVLVGRRRKNLVGRKCLCPSRRLDWSIFTDPGSTWCKISTRDHYGIFPIGLCLYTPILSK